MIAWGVPRAQAPSRGVRQQVMLVDTHIHYLPGVLRDVYRRRSEPPMIIDRDHRDAIVYGAGHVEPLRNADEQREALFAALDEIGTDVALVSINQPGVLGLPEEDGIAIARDANDELLALAGSSGGRITGLATLAWRRPGAAVEELERVVALGMRGADGVVQRVW